MREWIDIAVNIIGIAIGLGAAIYFLGFCLGIAVRAYRRAIKPDDGE